MDNAYFAFGIFNDFPSSEVQIPNIAKFEKTPSWISNGLVQALPRHLVVELSPVFSFYRGEMSFRRGEMVSDYDKKKILVYCFPFETLASRHW
jgi:hypothetical protein